MPTIMLIRLSNTEVAVVAMIDDPSRVYDRDNRAVSRDRPHHRDPDQSVRDDFETIKMIRM
jgi:hypothetical protein